MAEGRLRHPEVAPPMPPRGNAQRAAFITPMGSRRGISQPEDAHRERKARQPFLLEHDLVLVTNEDDVDWGFSWDRRRYVVPVGKQLPVPFPAVVNMMGDPRSVDGAMTRYRAETGEHGVIPTRYESLTSLFARYGITEENVDKLVDFAPKVRVTTMTGQLVTFPSQIPDATPWPVPQTAEPGREKPIDTSGIIERYEGELAQMRAEQARLAELVDQRLGGERESTEDPGTEEFVNPGAQADPGPRAGR